MSINPYRRHVRACQFREQKSAYTKCHCPIWADGSPLKNPRNLRTTDWNDGLRQIVALAGGEVAPSARVLKEITLADASAQFFLDPDADRRGKDRTRKHKTLHKQLLAFAARRRVTYIDQIDPTFVADFRTWFSSEREDTRRGREGRLIRDSHLAANKKFENLRQFFRLALRREWIAKDPTAGVTLKPVRIIKKKGFEPRVMLRILEQAAHDVTHASPNAGAKENALRVQALVLFLRYSGLRISDAVGCPIDAVKNGRVRLTTRKNHVGVDVQLPPVVTDALAKIPTESEQYFFWRGVKNLTSRVGDYQGYLYKMFKRAGVPGHAHLFRHTFAISLLEQPGKTLQDVADALGDTLAVVQKHYSGHSDAKQRRIDEAVRDTWRNDPVLAMLDGSGNDDGRRRSAKGVN